MPKTHTFAYLGQFARHEDAVELLITVSKGCIALLLAFVDDLIFRVKSGPKFGTCGKFHIKFFY